MKVSPSLYSSKLPTLETVNLVRNTLSEYIHIDVKDVPNLDRVAHDIKIVRDRSDLFIDIHLIDKNIAIVKASFSRYDKNEKKFYDGNGIYQLKKSDNNWKIFSMIPFQSFETL